GGCRIEVAAAPWIRPRKAGEVARPKDQGARRRGSKGERSHAASTMLRVVPLPRDAGEDQPEASYSAAARFGVASSGRPGWPVSLSPSSHIASACFFIAGRTSRSLP